MNSLLVAGSELGNEPEEAHTTGAYPDFCSIKELRVLLLPTG